MIRILIKDNDLFFMNGMEFLFKELFEHRFNETVKYVSEYTPENIALSDVIVLSLCKGSVIPASRSCGHAPKALSLGW
jgi:hypothetical protein